MFEFVAGLAIFLVLNIAWIYGGHALARKLGITGNWSTYIGQVIIWGVLAACAIGAWIALTVTAKG